MPERTQRFGDVGIERMASGHSRKVMWLTAGQVILLSTSDPSDEFALDVGTVTWEMTTTDWKTLKTAENRKNGA